MTDVHTPDQWVAVMHPTVVCQSPLTCEKKKKKSHHALGFSKVYFEMAEDSRRDDVSVLGLLNNSFADEFKNEQSETCLPASPDEAVIITSALSSTQCDLSVLLALAHTVSHEADTTGAPGQHSDQEITTHYIHTDALESKENSSHIEFALEDKENDTHAFTTNVNVSAAIIGPAVATDAPHEEASADPPLTPGRQAEVAGDAEAVRMAREEGRVDVVFPGPVTQEGCCRFVSEILKCVLYQRQQLPMTYDQLLYSQKRQQAAVQAKDLVIRKPVQSAGLDWRKCERTLQELEEVLHQLEALFSLSLVPRVLLLLGGSVVLPKELYEVNMEAVILAAGGDHSLRVSSCLRQLFRTLFVADLLSDTRPVCLMATTVMVLAHRDCGVDWFRPKLNFKVPTKVKSQVIALSSDPGRPAAPPAEAEAWEDYVWFQTPVSIKGFSSK